MTTLRDIERFITRQDRIVITLTPFEKNMYQAVLETPMGESWYEEGIGEGDTMEEALLDLIQFLKFEARSEKYQGE